MGIGRSFGALGLALLLGIACGGSPSPAANKPLAASPVCQALANGDRAFSIDRAEVTYTAHEQITKKEIQNLLKIIGIENTAIGRTSQVSGEVDLAGDLSISRMQVTADLRTLSSDSSLRDDRIRNEFLESNRYPKAIFAAVGVPTVTAAYAPGRQAAFAVPGRLTVRGITNAFTLNVKGSLSGSTLFGTGSGMLQMKDYGFDPPAIAGAIQVKEGLLIGVTFSATETRCSQLTS
jgi:polyisoprenoid-binding protein YceI